jgi:hypothetical protein
MANSSSTTNPGASIGSIRFYPRRDAMLGLYGLAMFAVIVGILLVMIPTVLAPGRVRGLLIPGVVLLLAGLALAFLGQLTMIGKRLSLEFDVAGWSVKPVFGRATAGKWTDVTAVTVDDKTPGQLILGLADGRSLGLSTRWLQADPGEIEREMRTRLDSANGYKTLEQSFTESEAGPSADDAR